MRVKNVMRQSILTEPLWRDFLPGLSCDSFFEDDGHVIDGVLKCCGSNKWFPVSRGVPCFLSGILRPDFQEFEVKYGLSEETGNSAAAVESESQQEQALTNVTFSDKWSKFTNYGLETTHQAFLFDWYCKKLGLETVEDLKSFYKGKSSILEVGPGSGFNTVFMAEQSDGIVFAADISEAAYTTFENTKSIANCCVIQSDLMALPFPDESFDFIIADGVLHHTPDTRKAVESLYKKLQPGGQFFFYIYRKMGAVRQFADMHIREQFSKLKPEDCYKACEGITKLGRELSKLDFSITLDEEIPVLGIPAGKHNVQRLVYYNFLKCFWNDAFDFETNNMVNFDWYHPHNAWQHSEAEVTDWLEDLGVHEYSFNNSNPNGISVLLRKPV